MTDTPRFNKGICDDITGSSAAMRLKLFWEEAPQQQQQALYIGICGTDCVFVITPNAMKYI